MSVFDFFCVGRIIFGLQTVKRIGELSAACGRRALVVANAGQRGDGGVVDRLAALLEVREFLLIRHAKTFRISNFF